MEKMESKSCSFVFLWWSQRSNNSRSNASVIKSKTKTCFLCNPYLLIYILVFSNFLFFCNFLLHCIYLQVALLWVTLILQNKIIVTTLMITWPKISSILRSCSFKVMLHIYIIRVLEIKAPQSAQWMEKGVASSLLLHCDITTFTHSTRESFSFQSLSLAPPWGKICPCHGLSHNSI